MTSLQSANHPRRGSYMAAAALLVMVSLFASSYGLRSLAPYALAAAVCAFQFFRPTTVGWCLIAATFSVASSYYLMILFGDVGRLHEGTGASVMLDLDDSAMFIAFLLVLLSVTIWVLSSVPISLRQRVRRLVQPNKSLERTREG